MDRLGNGTTEESAVPQKIIGLNHVQTIHAKNNTAAARLEDGRVFMWGNNTSGQFGNGTNNQSFIPTEVFTTLEVSNLQLGNSVTFVTNSDGTVYSCGWNYYGMVGDGTTVNRNIPTKICVNDQPLVDIQILDAQNTSVVAKDSEGNYWAWGQCKALQALDATIPASIQKTPRLLI